MTTFKRVGFEIDAQGQALDYAKRAMSITDNHPTPVVPAELCGHAIKPGRKCSICREDATKVRTGPVYVPHPMRLMVTYTTDTVVYFRRLDEWSAPIQCMGKSEFMRRFQMEES